MDAFLVKVWRSDEPGDDCLRGTVEHVRTHQTMVFRSAADLVGFLEEDPLGGLEEPGEEPRP